MCVPRWEHKWASTTEAWCGIPVWRSGLVRAKTGYRKRRSARPRKDEVIVAILKMTRQPAKHLLKKVIGVPDNRPRELDPMVMEAPGKGEGIQVEIRRDSETVVDWIARQGNVRQGKGRQGKARQGKGRQGKARQGNGGLRVQLEELRKKLRAWWCKTANLQKPWVDKCVSECACSLAWCISGGMHCTATARRNRTLHPGAVRWVSCGSGVRCFVATGCERGTERWVCSCWKQRVDMLARDWARGSIWALTYGVTIGTFLSGYLVVG